MLATTKRATIVALWLVCCYNDQAATNQHDHARTKSSTRVQKAQYLTTNMPTMTVVASSTTANGGGSTDDDIDTDTDTDTDADIDTDADADTDTDTDTLTITKSSNVKTDSKGGGFGGLQNFLFRKPNKIFKNLMRTSVKVVQRGMNAFQGVSNKVYRVARKQIGGQSADDGESFSSASPGKSDEGDDGNRIPVKRQVVAEKKPTGFVKRVAKMLDTGIAGIEQVTDLGLLLGNIGTHKIMAKLDGKSGNQEIFKMLVKYVGSQVGKGAKGNVTQFLDDVGTVSTFASADDEVTASISTLMEKLMSNPKVSKAMVRLVLTVLDGSPSTSCLLDQLPLSPRDVRMVFDVFVGSSGQVMLKTIAGLVSGLTTGPDTKEFLGSILGMMSMFKSDTPVPDGADHLEKPTSIVGSLTNMFTGGYDSEEDDIEDVTTENIKPLPIKNNRKNSSSGDISGNVSKSHAKTPAKPKPTDDDFFSKTETLFGSPNKKVKYNEDPFFAKTGITINSKSKNPTKSKSDEFFESSSAKSVNSKVHKSENDRNKKNKHSMNAESRNSDSTNLSDEFKIKKTKPNKDDDFDTEEDDK